MEEKYFTVGKIVNTHGIRGEVKVLPQTDFPEIRFAKKSKLLLFLPGRSDYIPLVVQSARIHKNVYIVQFANLENINQVEHFKNGVLKVSKEDLVDLAEGEYYYHEIIGCQVVTDEGEELGKITEILTPGANDVWVVRANKGKDILIPVIDDVVLDVNVEQKRVKIHLMEGLL